MGDVIFAVVSNQCPQGPAHLGNSSHLNVADEGFKLKSKGGVFEDSRTAKIVFEARTVAGCGSGRCRRRRPESFNLLTAGK
jgi:hypothetical protein